jgi:hypothetical protein
LEIKAQSDEEDVRFDDAAGDVAIITGTPLLARGSEKDRNHMLRQAFETRGKRW